MHAQSVRAHMVAGFAPMPAAMGLQPQQTPLPLAPVGAKAVARDFDGGPWSADAGVLLLQALDDHLGFTHALAAGRSDRRDARRVKLTRHALLTQRVLPMAAGDDEAHAANPLRDAPRCTLRRDRLPDTGAPGASHPTRSRCAHRVSRTARYRMAVVVLQQCIAAYDSPPQVIVLAVDATAARGQGQPEQARDDGSDGGDGLRPRHLYAGLSGRLLTTLRKATRCTGTQRRAVWQRVGQRLRHAWPDTLLRLRGESHWASPEVRQGLAAAPARSAGTGLTSNAVCQALAREVVEPAQRA
jgi:DDE family transposase